MSSNHRRGSPSSHPSNPTTPSSSTPTIVRRGHVHGQTSRHAESSAPSPVIRPYARSTPADENRMYRKDHMTDTMLHSYASKPLPESPLAQRAIDNHNTTPTRQPQFIFDAMREMRERGTLSPGDEDYDLRPEEYFVPKNPKNTPITVRNFARRSSSSRRKTGSAHTSGYHTPTDRSVTPRRAHLEGEGQSPASHATTPTSTHVQPQEAFRALPVITTSVDSATSHTNVTEHAISPTEPPYQSATFTPYGLGVAVTTDATGRLSSASGTSSLQPSYNPFGADVSPITDASSFTDLNPPSNYGIGTAMTTSSDENFSSSGLSIMGIPTAVPTRPSIRSTSASSQNTLSDGNERPGFLKRMFGSSSKSSISNLASMSEDSASVPRDIAMVNEKRIAKTTINPDAFASQLLQSSDDAYALRGSLEDAQSSKQKNSLFRSWKRPQAPLERQGSSSSQYSFRESILGTVNLLGGANLSGLGAPHMTSVASSAAFGMERTNDFRRLTSSPSLDMGDRTRRFNGYRDEYDLSPRIGFATSMGSSLSDQSAGPLSRLNSSQLYDPSNTSPDLARTDGVKASSRLENESTFLHDNSGSEERSPTQTPRLSRRHQELRRQRLEDPPASIVGPFSPLSSHPIHTPAQTLNTSRSTTPMQQKSSRTSLSTPPASTFATPNSERLKSANPSREPLMPTQSPLTDDGWVVAEKADEANAATKTGRVWLQPMTSEEILAENARLQALDSQTPSPLLPEKSISVFGLDAKASTTATNTLRAPSTTTTMSRLDEKKDIPAVDHSTSHRNGSAVMINDEDGRLLMHQLGDIDPNSEVLRREYMTRYNFTQIDLLVGLRELCSRLPLRGESQQVDRVLSAFSQRWCECNPNDRLISQGNHNCLF